MSFRGDRTGPSRRQFLGLSRGTLRAVDDSKQGQLVDIDVLDGEATTEVEYAQPYGFFSVPVEGAEVSVTYLAGNRSYPLVSTVSDRRHRPTGHQPGDAGVHDNRGQIVELVEGGVNVTTTGTIHLKAAEIIIEGTVKLGTADASRRVSGIGHLDNDGDALIDGANTVFIPDA